MIAWIIVAICVVALFFQRYIINDQDNTIDVQEQYIRVLEDMVSKGVVANQDVIDYIESLEGEEENE